jgi:hypothetical protein
MLYFELYAIGISWYHLVYAGLRIIGNGTSTSQVADLAGGLREYSLMFKNSCNGAIMTFEIEIKRSTNESQLLVTENSCG